MVSHGVTWRVSKARPTLLPQVTAFWRAPMGPGAARAVAARRMLERMEQRILAC